MCQFLSGIGFKNGDVITSDYTDRHELLILAYGLRETPAPRDNGWVRLEYTSDTKTDIDSYKLGIDETDIPSWVTDKVKEKWISKLRVRLKDMIIITGEKEILLGGKYILGGDAKILQAYNVIIVEMWDSSQIGTMWGSSQVSKMYGSSQAGTMYGQLK